MWDGDGKKTLVLSETHPPAGRDVPPENTLSYQCVMDLVPNRQ